MSAEDTQVGFGWFVRDGRTGSWVQKPADGCGREACSGATGGKGRGAGEMRVPASKSIRK